LTDLHVFIPSIHEKAVLEEREKRRKLWMIAINWTNWKLSGNRSGRDGLKEGEDVAVGERTPRKKKRTTCGKTLKAQPPQKKGKVTHRLFRTNILKEGAI
jgi:hypothetical protein